ncbi:vesicle transport through interaction with t-SNAREs homolog 1A isoform X6 [Gopherus flavomarginatus]|uniref:vesicle transport through interaction with t-SNAREs homolog 1A isoform X6 n=1 Tax=Gopherus flavomarginatus TaxID=286002 RepID=UPI0021CC4426|nr:vesicle transport through interaction with t-SNAREs homolog 1A isoform X6 [Gopherus flavomarginatus]
MEATSAPNFSSLPTPSRRLAQIRRRKKKTRDEMFLEIMEVTRNERAHLNEWKDVVAKYRKDASEREDRRDQHEDRRNESEDRGDTRDERWQQEDQRCRQEDQRWRDATLELLRDQIDILRHLVDLQEEQRGHRVPLQPLCNHPHHSPCSVSSSPRCIRTRGGRLRAPTHSTPVDSPTKRLSLH